VKWLACASALSLAVVLAVTGCGGDAPHGSVTGILERVGGPAPGSPVPLPGHVVAVNSAGAQFAVAVGNDGRFSLSLPAGSYQLTGYSPLIEDGKMRCITPHAVSVATGRTEGHVAVVCSIP